MERGAVAVIAGPIKKTMKMNITKQLALFGLALASAASAQATFYADVDQIPETERWIGRQHNRTVGYFNIVVGDGDTITIGLPYHAPGQTYSDVPGFTPGRDKVDAISAWFYFRDNNNDDRVEAVRVDLDHTKFLLGGTSSNPLTVIGNKSFSIFGGDASGAIQALEKDGILKYQINRVDGDFYFDYARLEVEAHVPDGGGTAILLGFGILAMGALRRKIA
jgi:VPDSG-CTERM motif